MIGPATSVQSSFDMETFVHPTLSYAEAQFGTTFGGHRLLWQTYIC
jgi:hypothetical protein